ncbi:p53-like transcription factor, DNA-binding [Phaffia rhodozyma]|uniref:p53-like transcription factor, DNA-binding n=1 Tax=Phaffia rhodozyma TaxID=264483 RepID=A0A0F7SW87_PHARH|nr:p53-like transcription factor, DNA-binding [Phaffia rhodozyma]
MNPSESSALYLSSDQRFKQGERSLIIISPVVGQKFLCPPPAVYLVGPAWFDPLVHPQDFANYIQNQASFKLNPRLEPPQIVLSISGEVPPAVKQATVRWTSIEADTWPNELFTSDPSADKHADLTSPNDHGPHRTDEPPLYGYAIDRTLYLTEGITPPDAADGICGKKNTKRVIKTTVNITAPPVVPGVPGIQIGTFEGKEIKLVSKPVRKKPGLPLSSGNGKAIDIALTHGSLLSLYQRHRSQASLTRYLCMSDCTSWILATDGSNLCPDEGLKRRESRNLLHPIMFMAKPDVWNAYIIWKVNTQRPSPATPSFPMPELDWPAPPEEAIPFNPSKPKPIRYNNTIMLQCPQSGALSPVLVIRRSADAGYIVGGDPEDMEYDEEERACCPPGEGPGELVTQLQKVALEVYSPSRVPLAPGSFGTSGSFFAIHEERIQTDQPQTNRSAFSGPPDPVKHGTASWFVRVEDRSLWSVVSVESVKHTFCIPRIPTGAKEGGRQLGILDRPVNPLPQILKVETLESSGTTQWIEHKGFKAEILVTDGEEQRDLAVLRGMKFQKFPNSSFSSYDLMFGTTPSPRTELRCEELLTAIIPDEHISRNSLIRREILDQGQDESKMDLDGFQNGYAHAKKEEKDEERPVLSLYIS